MKKNIKTNAVLNAIKSCLSLIFPLITYPYVLRILGATNLGKVSYVSSIVTYFSMFAMLGINSYAVREGSKIRDDKNKINKLVSELFSINVLFMIISYCLLCIVLLFVKEFRGYYLLFAILGLSIALQVFSIEWVNTIYEDFLYITVRSILIYIVNIILLFIFVKQKENYIAYAILQIVPTAILCIVNQLYCRKYVNIKFTFHLNLSSHLKPLLILFANTIMVTIYVNFDTTMIGWIKGDYSVGMYSSAVKVYSVIKNILVAIYIVAIPRLATYIGDKDIHSFKLLYTKMWGAMSVLLVPMSAGLIALSKEIMLLIGGSDFIDAYSALSFLSLALLFAIYAGLVTSCLNVVIGREKENLIATTISAFLNFALNFIFIPVFGYTGAAVTTLISEAFVFLFCFIRLPDKSIYLNVKRALINLFHAVLGSTCIIVFSFVVKKLISNSFINLFIIIPGSVFIYAIVLILLKNEFAHFAVLKIKEQIMVIKKQ